tara:strand:- start:462 stop:1085 length:624 start_codon:yes stop_codon:yes gene_type:complete
VGAFLFSKHRRVIIQNMKKMFIYLFLLNILFAQQELKIEGYDHMPLHTKLLWGKSGLFRKLNLAPDNRKDELKLRVRMLQTHQKLALASLGLVAYQSNLGNKMLDGDYSYYEDHKKFSRIAWVTYMTSASLSYFAPPALKYEKKISSMKIHRLLSYVHFTGMMAAPILGVNIVKSSDYDKAVRLHQNVALVTLGSLTISALLTVLPY